MEVSQKGVDLVKKWEGLKLDAYIDPVGVVTIGYGTTRINGQPVRMGTKISKEQAEYLLKKDIEEHASTIFNFVTVPLNQNQYDALASFQYNLGSNILANSTLLTYINNREWKKAAEKMKEYNKGGGQVLQGLVNRRNEEAALFLSSSTGGGSLMFPTASITEWLTGDTQGLNTGFAERLAALAKDKGVKLNVVSGYRTIEEQKALWEKSDKSGKMVAAPGRSRHNYAIAVDTDGIFRNNLTNTELAKYGLYKPMSYEPWHIEPIETKGVYAEEMANLVISNDGNNLTYTGSGLTEVDPGFDKIKAGSYSLFWEIQDGLEFKDFKITEPIESIANNGKALGFRVAIFIIGLLLIIFGLIQVVGVSNIIGMTPPGRAAKVAGAGSQATKVAKAVPTNS